MIKLTELLRNEFTKDTEASDLLEYEYARLNELKIDELNSYEYQSVDYFGDSDSFQFEDRCGNKIVAVYMRSIGEFKSGFRVDGVSSLVFDPSKLPNGHDLVKPCADDKRVNTVYKILVEEIVPKYLLDKKPSKMVFNPVSESRRRLVDMIVNKVIERYPQLKKKGDYIIHV